MSTLVAIVLAAGHGTRMKGHLPKVLHPVAGRPLLFYAVAAALEAGAEIAVVVTSGNPLIEQELVRHLPADRLRFQRQDPPRGTGDAARIGLSAVRSDHALILCADTPLLRTEDLSSLVSLLKGPSRRSLVFMTAELVSPSGYGRVLRDGSGRASEIREEKDLTTDRERSIREVNAGVYAARSEVLGPALDALRPDNAQGEYYLTDVLRSLGAAQCEAVLGHEDALLGVNDRVQLKAAEQRVFQRIAERHGRAGVTVRGDARIDDTVSIEPDVVIEAGVHLRGMTQIRSGAVIDVGAVIENAQIGEGVWIKPYSVITGSQVDGQAQIGPFAHLRPGSVIEERAHLGNFVETKKTRVRRGAKANHLSYLGDGDIGENANVGAGTIFCNYDGVQKHRTVIGENAFIGSDSQLVAPVSVGAGAFVASGTTVTRDVPEGALAISRTSQENKAGYAKKLWKRFETERERKKSG